MSVYINIIYFAINIIIIIWFLGNYIQHKTYENVWFPCYILICTYNCSTISNFDCKYIFLFISVYDTVLQPPPCRVYDLWCIINRREISDFKIFKISYFGSGHFSSSSQSRSEIIFQFHIKLLRSFQTLFRCVVRVAYMSRI